MIYFRDDIPKRLLLKHVFLGDIECLFIKLIFRKCKWLGTYHPLSLSDQCCVNDLDISIYTSSNYEKKLLVGDFKCTNNQLLFELIPLST